MIKINKLKQTCSACPSQWEFYTFDNRPVYVRYRWGYLSVCIGRPDKSITDAITGIEIVGVQLGDSLDGVLHWDYVKVQLNKLTKEKVLKIIHNKTTEEVKYL